MSTAWQTLQDGDFDAALALARSEHEAQPDDINRRFFLAQLLVAAGDPSAASQVLDVPQLDNPADDAGLRYHQGLLRAEQKRLAWLTRGEGAPAFALPPPPWAEAWLGAQQQCRTDPSAALETIRQIAPGIPGSPGTLDGTVVTDLRDADDLLGPFLEALAPDIYLLIPFSQIQSLRFFPMTSYPEVLWRSVDITLSSGSRPPLRVPTLYVGAGQPEAQHRLGNLTSFEVPAPGLQRGVGQRHLLCRTEEGNAWHAVRSVESFEAGVR